MIQCQNDFNQSVNRTELDQFCNPMIDKNKKTLPNTFSTIPDSPSYINEESWYLGDFYQYSILSQNFDLDQYQPIDKLASFHFNEIELEDEYDINS